MSVCTSPSLLGPRAPPSVPTKFMQVTAVEVCMSEPSAECQPFRHCRRQELSYECKATLFDQEVRMAENIDFQFPMKKACSQDIQASVICLSSKKCGQTTWLCRPLSSWRCLFLAA